ncbi:MAG: hypothetical protein ACLR8P_20370 [Clostridium fessum]
MNKMAETSLQIGFYKLKMRSWFHLCWSETRRIGSFSMISYYNGYNDAEKQ